MMRLSSDYQSWWMVNAKFLREGATSVFLCEPETYTKYWKSRFECLRFHLLNIENPIFGKLFMIWPNNSRFGNVRFGIRENIEKSSTRK